MDVSAFQNLPIYGGFTIARVELRPGPLVDAIGREAIARTSIIGQKFEILMRTALSDEDFSITLYHEILEAMTVASDHPPISVTMLNEAGFERAARRAHAELGLVSPRNLARMLQSHGFSEE